MVGGPTNYTSSMHLKVLCVFQTVSPNAMWKVILVIEATVKRQLQNVGLLFKKISQKSYRAHPSLCARCCFLRFQWIDFWIFFLNDRCIFGWCTRMYNSATVTQVAREMESTRYRCTSYAGNDNPSAAYCPSCIILVDAIFFFPVSIAKKSILSFYSVAANWNGHGVGIRSSVA